MIPDETKDLDKLLPCVLVLRVKFIAKWSPALLFRDDRARYLPTYERSSA